jgi:hypothetical protein
MAEKTIGEKIDEASEAVAKDLLAHPMLTLIITAAMSKYGIPCFEENKIAMVDAVLSQLQKQWAAS